MLPHAKAAAVCTRVLELIPEVVVAAGKPGLHERDGREEVVRLILLEAAPEERTIAKIVEVIIESWRKG